MVQKKDYVPLTGLRAGGLPPQAKCWSSVSSSVVRELRGSNVPFLQREHCQKHGFVFYVHLKTPLGPVSKLIYRPCPKIKLYAQMNMSTNAVKEELILQKLLFSQGVSPAHAQMAGGQCCIHGAALNQTPPFSCQCHQFYVYLRKYRKLFTCSQMQFLHHSCTLLFVLKTKYQYTLRPQLTVKQRNTLGLRESSIVFNWVQLQSRA